MGVGTDRHQDLDRAGFTDDFSDDVAQHRGRDDDRRSIVSTGRFVGTGGGDEGQRQQGDDETSHGFPVWPDNENEYRYCVR